MSAGSHPIGILSAIPPELGTLRGSLESAEVVRLAGRRGARGVLDGREVVLAEAGIGKVSAAVAVSVLVERWGCNPVVFTGVAGSLDPDLRIGDVVVAERTVHHDSGVIGPEGLQRYQAGHVPFFNPTDVVGYPTPPELLCRVRRRLDGLVLAPLTMGDGSAPRILEGVILTGDQFVNSEAYRDCLRRELGASAVEMEGAAVAQAASILGVDHLVIRSLSDLAGADSHLDFGRFLNEVAANSAAVVRHLLPIL